MLQALLAETPRTRWDSLRQFQAALPAGGPFRGRPLSVAGWRTASASRSRRGYRAALRALVPELGDRRASFCVTEAGGNHPRAIETRLENDRVTGPEADGRRWPETPRCCWSRRARASSRARTASVWCGSRPTRLGSSSRRCRPRRSCRRSGTTSSRCGTRLPRRCRATATRGMCARSAPSRTSTCFAAVLGYWYRPELDGDLRAALVHAVSGLGALAGDDPSSPAVHLALGGRLGGGAPARVAGRPRAGSRVAEGSALAARSHREPERRG